MWHDAIIPLKAETDELVKRAGEIEDAINDWNNVGRRPVVAGRGKMSKPKVVKRLSSGYWYVGWSGDLWFQWPVGSEPTKLDGFGWVTEAHRNAAIEAVLP